MHERWVTNHPVDLPQFVSKVALVVSYYFISKQRVQRQDGYDGCEVAMETVQKAHKNYCQGI